MGGLLRVKPGTEPIIIDVLSVLLIIIVAFVPSNMPPIILGLPFMCFFPGYILTTALVPKRFALSGIERKL